jgi:hypothetical protein
MVRLRRVTILNRRIIMSRIKTVQIMLALTALAASRMPAASIEGQDKQLSESFALTPEWKTAEAAKEDLEASSDFDQTAKASLLARFAEARQVRDAIFDGTAPISQKLADHRAEVEKQRADALNQQQAAKALKAEIDATPEDSRTEAWAAQTNKRVHELDAWQEKVDQRKTELDAEEADLDQEKEQAHEEWIGQLKGFILAAEFPARLKRLDRDNPVNAPLSNDATNRSAYDYAQVINQFRVEEEKNRRYQPDEKTYCNIFLWDVTRAMHAEIPHWIITGDPNEASAVDANGNFTVDKSRRRPITVNETVNWLRKHADTIGWRPVDAATARAMAHDGHPAIAIWKNPNPKVSGHVAIVRPGSLNEDDGVAIAQAGRSPDQAAHMDTLTHPENYEYWCHD